MGVIDVVFPVKCVGCEKVGRYICEECWGEVGRARRECPVCGRKSRGGWAHRGCKVGKLTRIFSMYQYRGVVQRLLKKVKYKSSWKMIDELAGEWAKGVSDQILDEVSHRRVIVTSVPMSKMRLRERGFNQAERLGRALAEQLGLEYRETLMRVRATKPQYGLSRKERSVNLKGAFRAIGKLDDELVILVDDVWTTGSTLRECSTVLAKSQVEEVWGVVVAS